MNNPITGFWKVMVPCYALRTLGVDPAQFTSLYGLKKNAIKQAQDLANLANMPVSYYKQGVAGSVQTVQPQMVTQ